MNSWQTKTFSSFFLLLAVSAGWVAASAQTKCADLLKIQVDHATLSEATEVAAGTPVTVGGVFGPAVQITSLPAHCLVRGEVNHHKGADGKDYGDRFELRMPASWQGRFLYMGGGGLDGILNPATGLQGPQTKPDSQSALSSGYAVVTTDGGHEDSGTRPDGAFGADPEARADYNYRSTRLVSDAAREIITRFYGGPIRYSYFQGCSNGGREGLMAAQRYPGYFDGIIAGAPAFNLTHAAIAEAWNTVELASISPKKPDGTPDLAQSLTEADLKLMVSAVLEKCDALDGLKDGLIFNPEACHFEPSALQCKGEQTSQCLPAEKVNVIESIFKGPHDAAGKAIYSTWPYDSGDAAEGWRIWMTGVGSAPSINVMIFPAFFNGLALAGAPPPIHMFTFNFDTDPARIDKAASEINASSTDWSAFRKRKAKLLLYTGMSDPVFSAKDLIRYYRQMEEKNGGDAETHSFARLFLVPGMNHCSGGPGLDDFDTLGTMQAWVEQDKAPESMLARGRAFPGRSRPLCAYPKIARYSGTGNAEDASSFNCQ